MEKPKENDIFEKINPKTMHPTIFSNSSYTVDYFLTITLNEVVEILESEYEKQVDDKQKEQYLKFLSWELYRDFHSIGKIYTQEENTKKTQRSDEIRLWAKLKEKLPNEYLNEYMLYISSTYYLEVKSFIYNEFGKSSVHKRRAIFVDFIHNTPLHLQSIFLSILRREAVLNSGGKNPYYISLEDCVNDFFNKMQQETKTVKVMKIDNSDLLNSVNEIIEKFDKSYKENQETLRPLFKNNHDIKAIQQAMRSLYIFRNDEGLYSKWVNYLNTLKSNNPISNDLLLQIEKIRNVFYSTEKVTMTATKQAVYSGDYTQIKEMAEEYLEQLSNIRTNLYAIKGKLEAEMGIISLSSPISNNNTNTLANNNSNNNPDIPKKVFISYNHGDKDITHLLAPHTKERIETLKQQLTINNQLKGEWEIKEMLADNPTEKMKCDINIKELTTRIETIKEELKSLM